MKLRISDALSLPPDFITQTAAILAIRGAGKSNLAAVIAEQMFAAKLPFVVIDPTGTWVGLRAAGTGSGLGVVIFGGREADVPLERGAGAVIADLIVEERLSSVIDLSELSEGDKLHFLAEFGRRLYQKNRDPLMLILEEADDYVPQKPGPRQAECLRVFQDIVRRGRARGLGIIMVTQRSAVISKDVLTQIETLFVLRTTSPQDRKAIEAWVDYHGQSRELVQSLPGLKPGEAWVWSPHYLGTVKRIQVDRRTTLDTAATPKDARGARAPATKADVDLVAVSARMAETIERAKADDPKELRRQIAELKRDLAKARSGAPDPAALATAEARGAQQATEGVLREHRRQIAALVASANGARGRAARAIDQALEQLKVAADALREPIDVPVLGESELPEAEKQVASPRPTVISRSALAETAKNIRRIIPADGLSGPEQRVLDALAELEQLGSQNPPRELVAFLAGYTNLTSKGFVNAIGRLRTLGFVEYPSQGMARAARVLFLEGA